MAKSKKSKQKQKEDPNERIVARNRKASHDYDLIDTLECGIQLLGSEVKSIRNGKIAIEDAFARVKNNELWLCNADIGDYPQATIISHERMRERKLLVKKSELRKFAETAERRGLTLVPTAVYLTRGLVKVKIAIAKGRKTHDKRDKLRTKVDRDEMRQVSRRG
ncbi:SsrA-binding protein SmpB [Calycomorphotria hydatis]|uniref:SsrA-binding protein n=1 Tax=Calycomorphotria hydatis TaxID=2528027 RepID=A0A517T825_9PLAN|nr:SsrA-binding protein SmpB [Calycomorphotria hydatis]QDT64517.1 SsrA-binding protein [Calycomorphotria hydatis]